MSAFFVGPSVNNTTMELECNARNKQGREHMAAPSCSSFQRHGTVALIFQLQSWTLERSASQQIGSNRVLLVCVSSTTIRNYSQRHPN